MHQPLMTFDFTESGDAFAVNCICADCRVRNTVPITAPTTHLAALTVALLAACHTLGVELSDMHAATIALSTKQERQGLELKYRTFLDRQSGSDGIDHRVIDPVRKVIVCGKKPAGADAA